MGMGQRLRPETRDTDTGTSLAVNGFHIPGLPIQHPLEVIDFSCAKRIHAVTHGIMTAQPAFLEGNTIWKNELRELSNTEFWRGSHTHGNNTGCIHRQHKRDGKREKSLLCMGNPSGPAGHLPYKAEEFCLRTDKLFVAMDLKSVAAYQRGSMKLFFPTEFRLSRK